MKLLDLEGGGEHAMEERDELLVGDKMYFEEQVATLDGVVDRFF